MIWLPLDNIKEQHSESSGSHIQLTSTDNPGKFKQDGEPALKFEQFW